MINKQLSSIMVIKVLVSKMSNKQFFSLE